MPNMMLRFFRRPANAVSGVLLLGVLLMMLFAPAIATHDPIKQDLGSSLKAPNNKNWLGTDKQGRDTFSRIVYGSRTAVLGALGVVVLSLVLGVPLGLLAGYFGGRIAGGIMRVMDVLLSFPALLLAILIVATFGRNLVNSVIALGLVYVPALVRVVRSVAMVQRQQAYVEAARAIGSSHAAILFRHILPNVSSPLIVHTTLDFGYAVLDLAALSFLGLGVQPPTADWGAMLSDARSWLLLSPYVAVFSGLAIMITVIAFNLFGDGLRAHLSRR